MNRKTFVSILEAIIEQERKEELVNNTVVDLFGDYMYSWTVDLVGNIVRALEAEFNNTELISWWLWDVPQAGKKEGIHLWLKNGEGVSLENAGELYDYLVSYETI